MKRIPLLFLLFFFSILAAGQYNPTPQTIDSLTQLLSKAGNDSTRYELQSQLGLANQTVNPERAVLHFNEAVKIAKSLNDIAKINSALLSLSFLYSAIGESPKSIEILHDVLQNSEKDRNFFYAMSLAFLGENYKTLGDYKNALYYIRMAYLFSEENVKENPKTFDEAGYIAGPMKLAEIFELMNRLDSALFFAQLSYKRVLEKPIAYFYCDICYIMGKIHHRLKYDDMAIGFYRSGLNKALAQNFPYYIQTGQLAIAGFFRETSQPDSAIQYAMQAYQGAKLINGYSSMKEAAGILRIVYEKQGNYAKALFYNDLAIAARDSVTGAEKVREVQNLTFKEERRQDKIQQEIEAAQKVYQNRIKIYSLLAVICGVLILATILYRNNRQKLKANSLLQEQKDEVHRVLANLKSTQAQLIQSEKMASLGELTSGIAHEIQNPLNFVNNFSEVNVELAGELKEELNKIELPAKNKTDLSALVQDIFENQYKILHHGKRAESIVKGMLQHSQNSIGVKEPTDINELADKYLKIAYHGLRGKNQSMFANMKTDFDENIGKINIIPQDIGRVMLNLFNNAFYAVHERKKQMGDGYEPLVSVTTKGVGNKIEIRIKDNASGIPKNIIDKIFQPFFTTKPTGQGTGLGLSLSYEIVKAHGGELKVESKEGQYAEFIIDLPV
jgi:two-component system NtrC family sensor kinase